MPSSAMHPWVDQRRNDPVRQRESSGDPASVDFTTARNGEVLLEHSNSCAKLSWNGCRMIFEDTQRTGQ